MKLGSRIGGSECDPSPLRNELVCTQVGVAQTGIRKVRRVQSRAEKARMIKRRSAEVAALQDLHRRKSAASAAIPAERS